MCYVGPKEKGREYLAAISAWDGEACLLNEVDEKSFLHQQDSVAQVLRAKGAACVLLQARPIGADKVTYQRAISGSYALP